MNTENSFEGLTQEELETHRRILKYDDFLLTGAVFPSWDVKVKPVQGYDFNTWTSYKDPSEIVPCITASISADRAMDVFWSLFDAMKSDELTVFLAWDYDKGWKEFFVDGVSRVVLESTLIDFTDLILKSGYFKIAFVSDTNPPTEFQLDEFKIFITYATEIDDLERFEDTFRAHGVPHRENMKFLSEAEHIRDTYQGSYQHFSELCQILGVERVKDTGYSAE